MNLLEGTPLVPMLLKLELGLPLVVDELLGGVPIDWLEAPVGFELFALPELNVPFPVAMPLPAVPKPPLLVFPVELLVVLEPGDPPNEPTLAVPLPATSA